MNRTPAEKRAAFRALHATGCFVIPNPWDVGSARMLQHLGFAALATTSSASAWATGRPDYAVSLDDVLQHLTAMCAAVDVPINADFESGFATEPDEVAANVLRAAQTGVAGVSIEDRDMRAPNRLYDTALAVERIRAARAALDRSGHDVMLIGRTEGLLSDPAAVTPSIDKLVALAEAGADCLFAPGVTQHGDIAAMVRAVAPKPLNVLAMSPSVSFAELRDLGVRRISVGGGLARVGWAATMAAATQMKEGSFLGLTGAASGKQLNEIFGRFVG
jgi:2-methylisocitrate lyase-like PEP mutase family enzyme